MRLPIYLVLFVGALLVTAVTIWLGTNRSEARTGVVVSAGALGLCGLVAMTSFNVVTVSGGQEFAYSYPSLAFVAGIAGAVNVVALFKGAIEEFEADL